MYNKTTSTIFLKYGKITDAFKNTKNYNPTRMIVEEKSTNSLVRYNENVYVELLEGMACIIVCNDPLQDDPQLFAIHRNFRINKGVYFHILTMNNVACYNLYTTKNAKAKTAQIEVPFTYHNLESRIIVKEITSYYYLVKSPHYNFPGEVHHLYELTYVDHGTLDTTVDGMHYQIGASMCLIYGPGQFHDQKVTSDDSCSYITIVFDAYGIEKDLLLNRVFKCNRDLVSIIEHFSANTTSKLSYKDDYIVTLLQLFLIQLAQYDQLAEGPITSNPINQHFEDKLLEEIITYITSHLYEPLPIEQVCKEFSISRSSLQNLFKDNLQIAPKQYINEAKLSRSRTLIRKGDYTISQISNMLGYTSIHYFSRKFTQRYGVAPSEFARKIYDENEH